MREAAMKGIILLLVILMVGMVSAQPLTHPVANITRNSAVFTGSGDGSDGWFEWGASDGGYYHWVTPNQTYSGTFYDTQLGSPMLTGQTYYVRACDETGCGNQVSWTVPAADLPNRTSFGSSLVQMFHTGFGIEAVFHAIIFPYSMSVPGGAPASWGLLFLFIFAGMWIKPRDIVIPCLLAMLSGGAIWLGTSALGVPPEFASVGQGLMYAAIAGMAVSWFSK